MCDWAAGTGGCGPTLGQPAGGPLRFSASMAVSKWQPPTSRSQNATATTLTFLNHALVLLSVSPHAEALHSVSSHVEVLHSGKHPSRDVAFYSLPPQGVTFCETDGDTNHAPSPKPTKWYWSYNQHPIPCRLVPLHKDRCRTRPLCPHLTEQKSSQTPSTPHNQPSTRNSTHQPTTPAEPGCLAEVYFACTTSALHPKQHIPPPCAAYFTCVN